MRSKSSLRLDPASWFLQALPEWLGVHHKALGDLLLQFTGRGLLRGGHLVGFWVEGGNSRVRKLLQLSR